MVERRLAYFALMILLWGGAVLYKIVSVQVVHHEKYQAQARARQEIKVPIAAPRGTLFDRAGRVLAMSLPAETVFINPLKVDAGLASGILAGELNLDSAQLKTAIEQAAANKRGYLVVKRRVSPEEERHLRSLGLEWIGFHHESQRRYPKGELAAHVLGSVDFEEKGSAGIEKFLDADLRGEPGAMRILTDVKRRGMESTLAQEARPGTPVTLTIDERLQFVAERELALAVRAHNAVSGSLVVMDPRTGDILAMASFPSFNPNLPPEPNDSPIARQNHAVSVPFEPGSVFKVITLSAALETTTLTPESLINCHGGVLKLPGRLVHDSHAGLGVIPMAIVLAKSSNVGAIEVGMRVGQARMYDYMRRFGFGQRTGIPLPAESAGKVRKLAHWGTTSLASVSMGQEVSVTTLQLAQAAGVIATGGLLVRPRLVLKKGDQYVAPQQPTRVINAETAFTMRQMMEGVLDKTKGGTGSAARLPGYRVGGKTGSAQIYDVAAHHYTHTYNGSFMGFAPLTNPQMVMVVTLNGTHGNSGFGGVAAAPVFHNVGIEALRVLDVPNDGGEDPALTLIAANPTVDDLADADDRPDQPNVLAEGDDDAEPAIEEAAGAQKAPNFSGMTMRAVLTQAASRGLNVVPVGSGVARKQSPPAGAVLHEGERIRVQFAR